MPLDVRLPRRGRFSRAMGLIGFLKLRGNRAIFTAHTRKPYQTLTAVPVAEKLIRQMLPEHDPQG
jgi:hypothetical protein